MKGKAMSITSALSKEPWFGAPIPASGYDPSIPDCGMTAARVPAALAPKDPVLVDLLRGGVYAIGNVRREGGTAVFEGLPLVDYPLAVADRSAVIAYEIARGKH